MTAVGLDLPGIGDGSYIPGLPLVSIVVTHMNYGDHVEQALRSIEAQTYSNWECVVVDDASRELDRDKLRTIVARLQSHRMNVIWLDENVGQIPAFYAGVDVTRGPFIVPIDPDDRLAPTFLEECVKAHLNPIVYAPIVSTGQSLVGRSGQLTGVYNGLNRRYVDGNRGTFAIPATFPAYLTWTPAKARGWHWTSTSAMMFRRVAVDLMRPHRMLPYKGGLDSYLAQGAHRLGGTLFLAKSLVFRTVHSANAYLSDQIVSVAQSKRKTDGANHSIEALEDVLAAIAANGGGAYLVPSHRTSRRSLASRLLAAVRRAGRLVRQ